MLKQPALGLTLIAVENGPEAARGSCMMCAWYVHCHAPPSPPPQSNRQYDKAIYSVSCSKLQLLWVENCNLQRNMHLCTCTLYSVQYDRSVTQFSVTYLKIKAVKYNVTAICYLIYTVLWELPGKIRANGAEFLKLTILPPSVWHESGFMRRLQISPLRCFQSFKL